MEKGIVFPDTLETLLVLRALGENAAEKAARGYLSQRELAEITSAMLELSDRFNGIDAEPLGDYMASRWHRAAHYLYFLPANFAKAWVVATELAPTFAGKKEISVLDVGSGPGSLSLGFVDFLARMTGVRTVRLAALDSSRSALEDYRFLTEGFAEALTGEGLKAGVTCRTKVADVSAAPEDGQFDIILFGDSLNELFRGSHTAANDRAKLVAGYAGRLAKGGSIVLIEPALKDVSRALQQVRDALAGQYGLHVYAPCLRQGPCPMLAEGRERDWCHMSALWMRPKIVKRMDKITGHNKFAIKFAYLVVRREDEHPVEAASNANVFRVVGDRIVEKGKSHILLCGNSRYGRFTLLTRDESNSTSAFVSLHRGDVVEIAGFEDKADGARIVGSSTVKNLKRFSQV